ncbi:MAG: DNA primase [bacterium]
MNITNEIRDRILNSLDIVDIISDVVDLHRKGANYWALCPFHGEKTPSFSVSPTKGIYKCFGCGVSGNIITFQMEYYKMTYPEAIKELARRAGVFIEDRPFTPAEKEKQTKRDLALGVLNAASDYYHKMLKSPSGKQALGYLRKRNFSDELIDTFVLGFAPDSWDALIVELRKQNYDDMVLIDGGLVIERDDGDIYDRFRNRVMFSIHDHLGKVVGFGARLLDDEIKQAKYINSPQTEIYDKSKILYGLFHSKDEIRKLGYAILTEGYADVLTLQQAGYRNSIASSGTSLTKEQLTSLFRYCKTIYFVFDADDAGIKATERGLELALEHGFNVMIVELPEGEDPDSIIRNLGGKNFQVYLDGASHFLEFLINKYNRNLLLKNPSEKAKIMRYLVELISKIPDRLQHDEYIKQMAQMMSLSDRQVEQIYKEKIKIERNKTTQKKTQSFPSVISKKEDFDEETHLENDIPQIQFHDEILHEEAILIQLILLEKDSYHIMTNVYNLTEEKFHSDIGKSLLNNLLRMRQETSDIVKVYFEEKILSVQEKNLITDLIFKEEKFSERWKDFSNRSSEKDIQRIIQDAIIKLELKDIKNKHDVIQQKMKINKTYNDEMIELLKQQQDLSEKEKKLEKLLIK